MKQHKCKKHPEYKGGDVPKKSAFSNKCTCNRVYIQKHWNDNSPHSNVLDISKTLVISGRSVRRNAEVLELKAFPSGGDNRRGLPSTEKKLLEDFSKFLMKGRTIVEISTRFDAHKDWLLKQSYPGYNLFTQRNRYREVVYILLPEITAKVELKKKGWIYHIPSPEDGLIVPFLRVSLPKFKGKIIIAPLFDVHYGHKAHRKEKFLQYIRWIEETPNVYAILGGDLMENALDDGRGMTYDTKENPQTQLDEMTIILSRIAHKIFCATPGNHEERTYKKTGIDIMQILSERLEIPYFNGPIFMSVSANTYDWNFHIYHGRGNSQTKGGKMNAAGRPRKFTWNVNFFISGHVHDALAEKETTISVNPADPRGITEIVQWTVVCQSFLSWADTYAYRAGYSPPATGGVSIELDANGDYRAVLV